MRRAIIIFLLFNVFFFTIVLHSIWTLLSLLWVDGQADAISRAELFDPGNSTIELPGQMIPRIIHQTWINDVNESIPSIWNAAQQSCIDMHDKASGWEYKLWTSSKSREFIAQEYSWFLDTFDQYDYNIQRADAIRYFALVYYGGIYIDLDDGCKRSLEPLLSYPAWLRKTKPTGISNDAMGAVAGHPFFVEVIDSLPKYNRRWVLPYISVMASTGPLFLSIMWRQWDASGRNVGDNADGARIRILQPDEYHQNPWSFFSIYRGNSWHEKDVQVILWVCPS